jgi:hypothetical protein
MFIKNKVMLAVDGVIAAPSAETAEILTGSLEIEIVAGVLRLGRNAIPKRAGGRRGELQVLGQNILDLWVGRRRKCPYACRQCRILGPCQVVKIHRVRIQKVKCQPARSTLPMTMADGRPNDEPIVVTWLVMALLLKVL